MTGGKRHRQRETYDRRKHHGQRETLCAEENVMESKREANFELLRVVAMLMIIALHYLNKGNLIADYTTDPSAVNYAAHFIDSFCIAAVNCYVLISGYFLAESAWKPGRVVTLAAQVLFYSILIPVVLACTGVISWSSLSVYDWLTYILPIETEHYWFATAYLLMYLFAPFLAAGMRAVDRRTLKIIIGILLLYFSVWKTVIPAVIATDRYGYEFGWFLCLFLIAGYIRMYGCPALDRIGRAALFYVCMSVCIFLLTAASGALARTMESFAYYMDMPTSYNHLFCLEASVALFMLFKDIKLKEGRFTRFITKLSPYTFGVYLLHEHVLVRYEWMKWLRVRSVQGSFRFLPHMLCCILIVYAAGTAMDYVRARIFRRAARVFEKAGGR